MPALARVVQANRFAFGADLIRQDHHLGEIGFVKLVGDVNFKVAKLLGKSGEGWSVEGLIREAQDAVLAERAEDCAAGAFRQRGGKVNSFDASTEGLAAWDDVHDRISLNLALA